MSTGMQNSAPTPSYFTSGQHFLETFTVLPETTRTTNSRWLQTSLSSNSKHDFCYTMANIFLSHAQQFLNLTMHFSLRHLAAKMRSQLYRNFISSPYFFLSYETCSININSLFHAAIKNLHITAPSSSSNFLILLYFLTTLSEDITTSARIHFLAKIITTLPFAKKDTPQIFRTGTSPPEWFFWMQSLLILMSFTL